MNKVSNNGKWFYEQNFLYPLETETKEKTIEALANLLFSNGFVKESYINGVLSREKDYPTGLPTSEMGVAIPHTDSIHVNQQAVAVGILKNPVPFGIMGDSEGSTIDVKLIFMLAVPDKDKVMQVLEQVMEIMQKPEFLRSLVETTDKSTLITMLDQQLNAQVSKTDESTVVSTESTEEVDLSEVNVFITHPVGLHARPATVFVKQASQFKSSISVTNGARKANAKSILSILSLGAVKGSQITIRAEGEDAREALLTLKDLVETNFGGID